MVTMVPVENGASNSYGPVEFSSFRFVIALPEQGLSVVQRIAPGRVQSVRNDTNSAGWKIAEVAVDSSPYAELIVLALGNDCRVVEPKALADAVAARARAALSAHATRRDCH